MWMAEAVVLPRCDLRICEVLGSSESLFVWKESGSLEIRLVVLFFIPEPCPKFCSQELNISLEGSVGLCHWKWPTDTW